MSLLADLLSKKNSGGPSSGKDIPPTLTHVHDIPAKVRSLKSRYIVITVVSVATIALGILAVTQLERLTTLLPVQKPAPAPQPVKPPLVVVPAVPAPPVITAPTAPARMVEPEKPAETALDRKIAEDRAAVKRKYARHKLPVSTGAAHRLAAVQPAHKALPVKPGPVATSPAAAPSGRIDTAKRDALLYAARSAEQASDWRLALTNYRKAQKIDPDNFIIINNTAAALNNLGMFDEGVREARRALAKKPDYVPAMINAAIAYSSKGNSQEALQLFSDAAIADPGNRSLVINLGILQERTGRLDEAQTTYRPLANDNDPLALQGMGRIYERKGNRGEAVRIYRQIMALPNASPAQKKEVKGKLTQMEE